MENDRNLSMIFNDFVLLIKVVVVKMETEGRVMEGRRIRDAVRYLVNEKNSSVEHSKKVA